MQSKDCSQKPSAKDFTKGSKINHAGKIQQTKIEKRKINKKSGRIYIYIYIKNIDGNLKVENYIKKTVLTIDGT